MKLPRKSKQWLREIEEVIDAAYQQLEECHQPRKQQFEAVLNIVIDRIAKNRRIKTEVVSAKKGEVLQALAEYLKSIPEANRDWSGIVTFLYLQFHQVLGLINEQQMLKIFMSQLTSA